MKQKKINFSTVLLLSISVFFVQFLKSLDFLDESLILIF